MILLQAQGGFAGIRHVTSVFIMSSSKVGWIGNQGSVIAAESPGMNGESWWSHKPLAGAPHDFMLKQGCVARLLNSFRESFTNVNYPKIYVFVPSAVTSVPVYFLRPVESSVCTLFGSLDTIFHAQQEKKNWYVIQRFSQCNNVDENIVYCNMHSQGLGHVPSRGQEQPGVRFSGYAVRLQQHRPDHGAHLHSTRGPHLCPLHSHRGECFLHITCLNAHFQRAKFDPSKQTRTIFIRIAYVNIMLSFVSPVN